MGLIQESFIRAMITRSCSIELIDPGLSGLNHPFLMPETRKEGVSPPFP
jgi:hypothetical protein